MSAEIPFGEWLRKQRRALDYTRQALADRAGCAEITLRRIESGSLKPSKELASILLGQLGIPESERPAWIPFARGLTGFPIEPVDAPAGKPLSNLPASLTTFVGREKEQVEVIKLVRKYRLVTLSGPGGVGKTRLSIKVGEQMLAEYASGVWLAELASLNDPAFLPQALMGLFGITTRADISNTEMLVNFLRARTALLILDNCEHLIEACAHLADTLLKGCPNLKILATSREPLGITGEAVYAVPSLKLPDLVQLLKNFRKYESVRLFEERAQLAKTDFVLTLESAVPVAQICQRLDGIPLAIELAAAHVNRLSADQIATRLTESFNLLTGGSRTALPRQQTIRNSIEWSWSLLSDSERILLRRLSVFTGGWTPESAEAVCGEAGESKNQVVELLSQLVAKSLIVAHPASGPENRYHLLETIREYAREKLVETGESENVCTRHLRYFLALSAQAEPGLKSPTQIEWQARLRRERDNIRAALEWAAKTDPAAGLALSGGIGSRFWESLDLREGCDRLASFLDRPESQAHPGQRARALYVRGLMLVNLYQLGQARSSADECLALFRGQADQRGEIDALILLARIIFISGDAVQYLEYAERAEALAESLGEAGKIAFVFNHRGLYGRDLYRALAYSQRAIALFRQIKDWAGLASSLGNGGINAMRLGDLPLAEQYLSESIALARELNNRSGSINNLTVSGRIAFFRGDYEQAGACIRECMAICQELGNHMGYLWTRAHLGYILLGQGEIAEARAILSETARDFQNDRIEIGVIYTLEGMAGLAVAAGQPDKAMRLIGWADLARTRVDDLRPPIEQTDLDRHIAACHLTLSEVAFSDAYAAGQAMTHEQAVAQALEEN